MNEKELIEELLADLCILHTDGLPNLQSEKSISYISEFFNKRGMWETGQMIIENLFEDDKQFKNPALNKVIRYKTVNGDDAEGKVGNLLRRPDTEDAYKKAVATLGGEDSDTYKKAMDDLGGEGQPNRDIEGEREDGEEESGEVGGEEPQTGTAFDPETKGGEAYLKNLPDEDPAKPDSMKDDKEKNTPVDKQVVDDKIGNQIKTSAGKTLYSIGGGYYADSPGGVAKYIIRENVNTEIINLYSALNEIQAQTNKGKQIIVDPIKPSDASQANIEAKKSQFPKFSEQSDDENVKYLIGTTTPSFKFTTNESALAELEESRNDAYSGKNAGKGGASTTAQEEVSCRIMELAFEFPELGGDELIDKMVEEMQQMPFYERKDTKQLAALAVKSFAGAQISKYVSETPEFDYNKSQPQGFPKSFAFTGKATQTIANLLVTKLKEAKESGDEKAIAHYENEIRKFAEHSTSATGKEGDGDTALMYMDNNGRVKLVHITNKQDYKDPKSNATKKSRALQIQSNAVEGTDVKKLTLINDIAVGNVKGMNEVATTSMKSLKNDADLQEDINNIPPNIIDAVYGTSTYDASPKYKENALKNILVQEKLKKMGVDKTTATDEQILKAVINTVGEEGSTQISDSTTGSAGKLLMKMGNLYKDVTSKFEILRKNYSQKTDEEICEMILINSKEAKSGNPLYGGKLSAEDICAIRVNKALQKLSEISDARGESMRTAHNKIVSETMEADIDYFMKKDGISEEEARDKVKSSNGPHTETVVRTFMKSMHWTRSIMGDADTEMLQSVGNTHVKSKYYRECLASLTGYDGDITTPDGRDGLINYLAKSVKITPGNGSVQFVNNKTGQTILLGEDTWRTAGDGEKIAGHDGADLIKCLKSKK